MKLRCRILGHDTYAYSTNPHTAAWLGPPETVLGRVCRRCGDRWSISIPPEGLHFTVLPAERLR